MQVGDKVTKDNYKRGYKVKRGPNWNYPDEQDSHSIYGVIVNGPHGNWLRDQEVKVLWIDEFNHALKSYVYIVGRGDKYDLEFAEDTVDYSLDDIFASLDELADKFKGT